MMPQGTMLCSMLLNIRSIRVFKYALIPVGLFMSFIMSFSKTKDLSNLIAVKRVLFKRGDKDDLIKFLDLYLNN